jgi:bifunctional DNA-binding transcriptional regulator/antitoxin component of YhaV-PrlF toxin-antitoxin module
VTIPEAIRKKLNLDPGVALRLSIDPSGRIVITPLTLGIEDLIGILPKPPNAATSEEIDAALSETAPDMQRSWTSSS